MPGKSARKREVVRYSEAFKQGVVRELEKGRYGGVHEAARELGIGDGTTVKRWVERAGRTGLLRKVIRVEKPGEANQVKELRAQIRQLKEALADAHVDTLLAEAYAEIALRQAGVEDVEGFKKKHHGKRPGKR